MLALGLEAFLLSIERWPVTQLTRTMMILVMKCPKTGRAFYFEVFCGRDLAALLINNEITLLIFFLIGTA